MQSTGRKRVVVTSTVVEVNNNTRASASDSMNPGRHTRHAKVLMMVLVAHLILCCFHETIAPLARSVFSKKIAIMQFCLPFLVFQRRKYTQSSPGLCVAVAYRE